MPLACERLTVANPCEAYIKALGVGTMWSCYNDSANAPSFQSCAEESSDNSANWLQSLWDTPVYDFRCPCGRTKQTRLGENHQRRQVQGNDSIDSPLIRGKSSPSVLVTMWRRGGMYFTEVIMKMIEKMVILVLINVARTMLVVVMDTSPSIHAGLEYFCSHRVDYGTSLWKMPPLYLH